VDTLGSKKELKFSNGNQKVSYYSLETLEKNGFGSVSKLPISIKVLLESVLRNLDGFAFTEDHVKMLASWQPTGQIREEIPYKPARVVLQDFTGVPAVVDLAAMRDAIKRLGGKPKKINPQIPCDLVIDHSVQVDFFGASNSLQRNEEREFERNLERYQFLKWGQSAFNNFRVVPPSTGIVHQVNLEHLSQVVYWDKDKAVAYPDSCVGTDSHTPMVNGLGVMAWGVGGIEAEAVMLNQPIYMLVPNVIGFKLSGKLPEGTTATDLVLRVTEICRQYGVVENFVEFFGSGLNSISVADRATIGNMAPEQGSTVSFFPVDAAALDYMRLTGRSEEQIELTERYLKAQGMFRTEDTPDPMFTDVIELDLSTIEPAVAGPKRPQDRIPLSKVGPTYKQVLTAPIGPKGFGLKTEDLDKQVTISINGKSEKLSHGAVVIAAITSCTNTSNPSVMIASGLVAKKACERGLMVKKHVKTSLAPGSAVVTEYLTHSGLLPYLEKLGFFIVGYGCTTCIGNSGPLPEEVSKAITDSDLVVSAVLSGNRNFEGRVNPQTRTNYLASPPLVVAYALAGTTAMDITTEPIGIGKEGKAVYLKDIWPTSHEILEVLQQSVKSSMFVERYSNVWKGSKAWQDIKSTTSEQYCWDDKSTYVQRPPFFDSLSLADCKIKPIVGARVLGIFPDSTTTDHISPAGNIAGSSPAGKYLLSLGVDKKDWNSYGSRRGNHNVMMRGTFANIRIKNQLTPDAEGNVTIFFPTQERMSFFDAAQKYHESNTPLMVFAGKEYGSGSSRDWAGKGPALLGIKVVIAESFERIHRSNLIGMGILPLQFKKGESMKTYSLTGEESFSFSLADDMKPKCEITVESVSKDGKKQSFKVQSRIDTPVELEYYRNGGILQTVLKNLAAA
jgi:aconitate hydratase